jgi:hypothetical protein
LWYGMFWIVSCVSVCNVFETCFIFSADCIYEYSETQMYMYVCVYVCMYVCIVDYTFMAVDSMTILPIL